MRKADTMIDAYNEPLADDDVPVLTELPAIAQAAMPVAHVQTRYHALLREVGRDGAGYAAGSGSGVARHWSLRWKLAVPGVTLGILAAALALSYGPGAHGPAGTGQGTGDSALAASWTAIPTAATAAQAHDAAQHCSDGSAQIVLAEQRGDVTTVLLASGSTREACVVGNGQPLSVSLWSASAPNQDFGSRVLAMQPFPAAFEAGTVASGVTQVTITLTNGEIVTATVADGWAFAWWPSGATAKTVTEYAANGTVVSTLGSK